MARATTVANGATNNVIATPRLEVLVSDLVPVFPQSRGLLLLIVLTSILCPLVLIASLKSIRETLSDAHPIVLNTAFELIVVASLVTIGVTSVPDCTVDLRTTPHRHTCSFASDDELDFDPDAYLDGDF